MQNKQPEMRTTFCDLITKVCGRCYGKVDRPGILCKACVELEEKMLTNRKEM